MVAVDSFRYTHLDVESQGGQRLILRTEFDGQSEYRASRTIVCRTATDMPYSRLLCGEALCHDVAPSV